MNGLRAMPLRVAFASWPAEATPVDRLEPGYTILLPSPMDMPFLLRFAMEGLRSLDLTHCREIIVVPDAWGTDGGRALMEVADQFSDLPVRCLSLKPRDYRWVRRLKPRGGSATHWLAVVNGTGVVRTTHCLLHDADAFFLDAGGLERQYAETIGRGMHALGVDARWDPFFVEAGMSIPGTWELMYATAWARSRGPVALKGRWALTDRGPFVFDTMLQPQYEDYGTGRIGVMGTPPRFVHFNGTIVSYRAYRDRGGAGVSDDLFRVLLLALLEDAVAVSAEHRVALPLAELAQGLTDASAPVRYTEAIQRRGYAEFRHMLQELMDSPLFAGARAARVATAVAPWDAHFAYDPSAPVVAALSQGQVRTTNVS